MSDRNLCLKFNYILHQHGFVDMMFYIVVLKLPLINLLPIPFFLPARPMKDFSITMDLFS